MLQMFTVHDTKAEAYLQPFFSQSRGAAIRSFDDAVNGGNEQFSRHAADYNLFHIGTWNPLTGMIETFPPISLGNGLDFLRNSGPELLAEGAN